MVVILNPFRTECNECSITLGDSLLTPTTLPRGVSRIPSSRQATGCWSEDPYIFPPPRKLSSSCVEELEIKKNTTQKLVQQV